MEIKGGSGLLDQLRMLKPIEPVIKPAQSGEGEAQGKVSFSDFLEKNIQEMNNIGLDLEDKIRASVEGTSENPHETMIAIQKADMSFRLMMNVKDQLEQAYQQIIRTSIG